MLRSWWGTNGNHVPRGNAEISIEKEMELAVQALRLNTLSKLLFRDCLGFDTLVKDVFPGIQFTGSGHEKLKAVVKDSFSALGLQYNEREVCASVFQTFFFMQSILWSF